jgi:hypothetical protein
MRLICCCPRKYMHEENVDVNDGTGLEQSAAASTHSSHHHQQQPHQQSSIPHGGMMGRFFSRKKKPEEDKSTDGSEAEAHDEFSHEPHGPPPTFAPNAPIGFHPSVIQSKITEVSNETSTVVVDSVYASKPNSPVASPPSARQSAFFGPPRFDWIDIVSILERNGKKSCHARQVIKCLVQ